METNEQKSQGNDNSEVYSFQQDKVVDDFSFVCMRPFRFVKVYRTQSSPISD